MEGERRRRHSVSSYGVPGLLLMLLVLQSTQTVIDTQEILVTTDGNKAVPVQLTDKDEIVSPIQPDKSLENGQAEDSVQLKEDSEVGAPLQLSERHESGEDLVKVQPEERLEGGEDLVKVQPEERLEGGEDLAEVRPEERLSTNDEIVAVSGDAEFEARKPRGLWAALFGYPDEFESVDPSSSSVVADASYSVNHEDGENGNSKRGTPAPQFKASQYAVSKKTPSSTVKTVMTTLAPKATTSKVRMMPKNEEPEERMNATIVPTVDDGNIDADNFTVTELRAPIVEVGNANETELNVTIIKEMDEDGDNFTRTERSSGNKREAVPSMQKTLQPQPLPAGYILWHPVPASFLGGPNMPNGGDVSTRESNNGPMALASEGAPMFMGPPHRGEDGPPFHPHRPFFVERNNAGNAFNNMAPFPITQFSTPNIFAVPPTTGAEHLHQNEPTEDEVKENKRNRNRERKERNRKKKGGKKNRPKNNEQQEDSQRDKQPNEPFQRPPLHLMLPPLPPNGFPNSPFMQPHNHPTEPEHINPGPGPNRPPPPHQPFNRDFPPSPMHQNGPPQPQFEQRHPSENVAFRNGNNERGPPLPPHPNMPFNNNNEQFHPRPSPSPNAHPVKFEIDHQQRLQHEQQERERHFEQRQRPPPPPPHHHFPPQNPHQHGPPPPNFQPPPPMHHTQNQPPAPNMPNGDFHHSSPPPQNHDVPPVHTNTPPRPPPNFQQFSENKPAARPMASQSQQQQQQTASEPPFFVTTAHNSHSQSLPDVPTIHFGPSPSPLPAFRNFRGPHSFPGPPPFHPHPPPNLGLDRNQFRIPNRNKEDSFIYTRDFPKSVSDPNLDFSTSSPSFTSNHLGTSQSPISRIATTTSPPPSTFGLPVTAIASHRPTSSRPTKMPKPYGLFSSTPHPHQLSPAASHRLPETHPNLPDYNPSSSTTRVSTVNGPYGSQDNTRAETTTMLASLQSNQDSYPSPGFHTGHKGYPSSVTAPNYVTSSEIPFHTTLAPPPRMSATAKSHYLHASTNNYGTALSLRHRGNNRGSPPPSHSSNDPTYEIQYQSPVPVTTTYSPPSIISRSSTSPSGLDVSPAYQQAQAHGGSYKPGTSRILLEMGQWSENGKKEDLQQQPQQQENQ